MINIALSCPQNTLRERENIHLRDHIAQNEVMIADRQRDGELNTYCRHQIRGILQCNRKQFKSCCARFTKH